MTYVVQVAFQIITPLNVVSVMIQTLGLGTDGIQIYLRYIWALPRNATRDIVLRSSILLPVEIEF